MSISYRRHFNKLPCSTLVVAILILIGIYIHDLIRSFNVEYVPVLQLPDDTLPDKVLGMNIQNILFYNRVPKTGSSSMKSMLTHLQVCVHKKNFFQIYKTQWFSIFQRCNNFKYIIAQQYEPRHMNKTQQVSS